MNSAAPPLCVDLDGTLTPIDTLHESLLGLAKEAPVALLSLPGWLAQGKAEFKHQIASRVTLDASTLPYHDALLAWLRSERASGRKLVLVTAANRSIAEAVANHLQVFDDVIANDGGENLSGERKRLALVQRFGEKGYDYAGNDSVDLGVWKSARQAIVVGPPALARRAQQVAELGPVFAGTQPSLKLWIKAARLYQWVKNLLIFVPALLAHAITQPTVLLHAVLAFIAFGLCASSVYLINDLLDLPADRRHKRKRFRPFASGALPARSGALVSAALLITAAIIAALTNIYFCVVLAAYYVVTWAYSLRLKRAALIDVMTLAGLYTIRIIAGSAAVLIAPSFWLLAFSIFLFLSLGIVKRYAELEDARQAGKAGGHGRGYGTEDLPLLMNLGTAAGYCAIVVMALYINSADSQALYKHAKPLWLICPLMLFWISRVWLLTTRGKMHDDPVIFALRDRASLLLFVVIGAIVALAI